LFYVRSGFFKTCLSAKDGREQVTGFHVVGDILGLDGIASGHLTTDAVALEDSEVWTLSFDLIEQYSKECASLRFQFLKTICSEVVRLQGLALMLGSLKAEERVAVFLINLLDKLKSRGMSQSEVLLRMSRDEIGSFLGIRQETVSRLLRVFSERRILEVDNRHIRVIDSSLLKLMAEPQGTLH
jgi:CRP/FNR family transcriptional regulator